MKITISKSQWEGIGKKTGWIQTAQAKSIDMKSVKKFSETVSFLLQQLDADLRFINQYFEVNAGRQGPGVNLPAVRLESLLKDLINTPVIRIDKDSNFEYHSPNSLVGTLLTILEQVGRSGYIRNEADIKKVQDIMNQLKAEMTRNLAMASKALTPTPQSAPQATPATAPQAATPNQ